MSDRKLRWFGLFLCSIVSIAVFLLPTSGGGERGPVGGADLPAHMDVAPSHAERTEQSARIGDRVVVDVPPRNVTSRGPRRVLVIDEGGGPIRGAHLYRTGEWASYATPEDVLATAGADGWIEWLPASGVPSCVLAVVGPGFLPGVIDADAEEQTVRLRRGEAWAVRCIDESGRPVSGVSVALGSAEREAPPLLEALGASTVEAAVLPGPAADRAVFVQVTGADGFARFLGLPPSRYYFRLEHASMVKLDTPNAVRSPQGGVLAPGPDLIVRMAAVHAAVVSHPGQQLVTYIGSVPRNQFESRVRTAGCAGVRTLKRDHPGSWVFSHVPAESLRATGRLPRTKVAFLFSCSGWVELDLEFRSVSEGVTPVVVPLRSNPVCSQRRFVIRPPLPEVPGFPAPFLQLTGKFEGRTVSSVVGVGEMFWFPPGRYRLSAPSQFVAGALALPESIEIGEGGPVDIELVRTGELVPCELRFGLPRGMILSSLSDVSVQHESGSYVYWPGWHARDAAVMPALSPRQWLPVGRVVLRATEASLGAASRWSDLELRDAVTTLELRWEGD